MRKKESCATQSTGGAHTITGTVKKFQGYGGQKKKNGFSDIFGEGPENIEYINTAKGYSGDFEKRVKDVGGRGGTRCFHNLRTGSFRKVRGTK